MVAEIGAGSLPHATFRFYFEQNLGYLREYARAIAFAATAATDRGALSILARFLGQIVDVEIPANEAFLERLGGSAARPVTMRPATYAYTRHLLDATSRGGAVPSAGTTNNARGRSQVHPTLSSRYVKRVIRRARRSRSLSGR